jgi:hypothetical protein
MFQYLCTSLCKEQFVSPNSNLSVTLMNQLANQTQKKTIEALSKQKNSAKNSLYLLFSNAKCTTILPILQIIILHISAVKKFAWLAQLVKALTQCTFFCA